MGNLKVAGLDIGSHNLTIDESSGTLLVDGEEVSGSGGGGISYVWANETARTATTGMKRDEQGVQQDTNTVYKYNGTVWKEYYVMSDSTVQKYYEGTSAPINSKIGDEWFDYNDRTLYKRVSDGTDSVWMAMNSLAGGGSGGVGTNYTTRNETLEANKTVRYPLNGVNNNYALHAFALKELPIGKEVLSLNTVLMGSGYYGVKIPRINNIQLSFLSGDPEPLKRMTTHNQHGQTVSATTEHNATYAAWKIFAAGDAPTAFDDAWASSRAPTPSDPQTITFISPNVFSMSKYKIRNRGTSSIASIKTWKIEGRVGSSGNWELIHEVVNDTRNSPLLDRVFDIPKENRKACDQHRLVIFDRNGTEPYTTLSRLIIYQEPSKFMIEDGVDKYRLISNEELELVPNVITKNDITVNGTSSDVFISKQKLSTLSNPYIITDEPSAMKLIIDSEKEYEYSNSVKITLANTYIKFTATESGKYKFCYQEPAPVIP